MEELGGHARSGLAAVAHVPRLAVGVELLGEYRGSGLTQATYLVRGADGQLVQLLRLSYLVLSEIDASRTVGEIAAQVTVAFGRTVSAANVEYLLANKLAPLGLVAAGEGASQVRRPDPAILALKVRRREVSRVAPTAGRLLAAAARLLPPADRDRYAEEYQSELWELAQSGTGHGRRRQLGYALRQFRSAPRTGMALRSPRRRSAAP